MARMTKQSQLDKQVDALAQLEPRFGAALEAAGRPSMRPARQGFPALMEIITGQQLSVASAKAIWARIEAAIDPMTPEKTLTFSDEEFRVMGMSGQKIRYSRHLAETILGGQLSLETLCDAPVDQAISQLTAVKGIGSWTAEIYLLFCERHADVFPAGDLALQAAAQHLFDLGERPAEKPMAEMATAWAPYRGAASLTLWTYYRHIKNMPPATGMEKI